jgi:CDGSH-type Zn-finger protein
MTEQPSVEIVENGPYKVCGVAMADNEGKSFAASDPAYLCRCGGSSNKPFCDGTHNKNGFDGTEVADHGPQSARRDTYVGDGVTIYDDRSVCAHAGLCTDGLPAVWKLGSEPWIDPTGASAEEIIAVVKTCPSGALTYSRSTDGQIEEAHNEPELVPAPNGPYAVRGKVPVTSAAGEPYEDRERITLCRCGESDNKPFCNGKHWECKFQAASGPAADE